MNRRDWLRLISVSSVFCRPIVSGFSGGLLSGAVMEADDVQSVVDIGGRLELFVDHFLIQRLSGLDLRLHEPVPASAMVGPVDPLEYASIIHDGELFRLYSRDGRGAKFDGDSSEVTRYYESRDGLKWDRPQLGIIELDGTFDNNVILKSSPFCHNFSPLLDRRPGVPADERFKALAGTVKSMLHAFVSGDGIHWRHFQAEPVIRYSKEYAFDSQNVAFWSESERKYVCYFRHFLEGKYRSVCRTTSEDFLTWTEPVPLRPNFPGEHLYTTLTHPYFRAPHIYVATPTRFHPDRGESTDIMFMTARGSNRFDRTFREAFIRPGLDSARWGNRSNYAALNVVQTGLHEMSIYVTPFRRFTMRLDGFASVRAGADGGVMVTKLFRFRGQDLFLNVSTSAGGKVVVGILDEMGAEIPGCRQSDCKPLIGDFIESKVEWRNGRNLAHLAGRPIRLSFQMQDADLFSMRFV